MVAWLIENYGGVDVLINNAGRSIRRGIESSKERFHDFERTMQLNYFGCLRTTMGLLPGMAAKRKGHVVNISSIGVLTNAPRFSALCCFQGGARCVDALCGIRVSRRRRHVHDDQHAAGAHADDRADEDLSERSDACRPKRRPTSSCRRSFTSRCGSRRGSACLAKCCMRWRQESRRS